GSSRRNITRKEREMNWTLGIGASVSMAKVYSDIAGIGFDVLLEKPLSQKFSFTARLGYNQFLGEYRETPPTPDSSIKKNFSNIPVMVGARYYFTNGLYAAAELGAAIAGGDNSTHLSLGPSVGYKFNFKKSSLDLSARYSYIKEAATFPENTQLIKGGYDIWSFHITYSFINF